MRTAHILLIEDNEGDILLTKEALEERRIVNKVSVVRDGEAALEFLFKRGRFADAETPDLILLDINLPRVTGHEVLQRIKTTETIRRIPVIMLTTSSSEVDIAKSYEHHANCYITKPVEVDRFLKAVSQIEDFWLKIVTLPEVEL